MIEGQKDKYKAYGISAALHLVIFVMVCLTGLFSKVSSDVPHNIDVDIYEAVDLSDAGGGDGGSQAAAASQTLGTESVSFNVETEKLPEIAEEYTKEPEKQQQYRQEHHAENNYRNEGHTVAASLSGAGSGSSQGIINGSGKGSGTGNASGTGDGAGSGAGSGNASGRDESVAKVAKVPPRFLGGGNPVYPKDLQDQGIGGTVILRLTVSADGAVTNVEVVESSGISPLDRAAVKAAYTYSFAPARNAYDEPVMCIMNKKVVFVP